jgi:hypothetical protein
LNQLVNDFIIKNQSLIESISKKVLKDRWREGVSAYFIHLYDKNKVPTNIATNTWYFMVNLSKPNSEINYVPVTLKGSIDSEDNQNISYTSIEEIEIRIDLVDERLVDFLLNNEQTDLWINIYDVFYKKKIKLDIFEEVIFDYVFNQGLTIREISKLTNNSPSWIYRQRKSLIEKIKICINAKTV